MAQVPPPRIGWPLLPVPEEETGRIGWPSLAVSVRDAIKVILQTRPGEQLMNPGFGAGLQDFVGQSNTIVTRRRIQDRVRDALVTWEPRILLEAVDVFDDPAQPGWVRVEIRFRLRRTGAPSRMSVGIALEDS